ncbi:hypothetical protein Y032_0059g3031 [Ancylostoma ceylanicum]|uniref:Uncharacterized protein n=1 Tax=Ancylostoma ceylanicum TaxID=53326 RepID=A0A016U3N1_9BILA|nr:hypothetical protein Y032_0059g3031 [Ancylostoma ceylanicum]
MAISDLIQAVQNVTWPEFLQPHVEVLLLWITWAVDYIDLDYLESWDSDGLVNSKQYSTNAFAIIFPLTRRAPLHFPPGSRLGAPFTSNSQLLNVTPMS